MVSALVCRGVTGKPSSHFLGCCEYSAQRRKGSKGKLFALFGSFAPLRENFSLVRLAMDLIIYSFRERTRTEANTAMRQPEVRLEFQYSEAEYLAASRLLFFNTPNAAARLIVFALLLVAGTVVMSVLITESFVLWASLLFVALLEGAMLYNVLVVVPRAYFRGDARFHDRHELTFSDEGVKVKTSQIDSKLAWSLYSRVVEGRDMYLLLYGKDTRMMTAAPKRVFINKEQENQFRELLAKHIIDHSGLKQIAASETEYKPTSLTPPDWR